MKKHYLLLILFLMSLCSNAQVSSDIDPDFDMKDDLPNITLFSKDFALQPDGKIVLVGNSCSYKLYNDKNEVKGNNILRLNKDLSLDETFKTGLGFSSSPSGLAIQPDGKILVSGSFTTYDGKPIAKIIRLNADGSIDNTFNLSDKGFNAFTITIIRSIKIQPDGKILISGVFDVSIYQKFYGRNMLRLNADGSVDKTFQPGSGYPYDIFKFELHTDGKIVRVYQNTYNKETSYRIDRLNSDGTIDSGFTAIEGFGGICSANTVGYNSMYDCKLAIQKDGKILFGGCYTTFKYIGTSGFMRFNTDGSKDLSFKYVVPGFPMATVKDFIFLTNDKILKSDLTLINNDGSIDNTIVAKLDANSNSNKILLCPDNKLLICTENIVNFTGGSTYFNRFVKLDLTTSEINAKEQPTTFYGGNDILEKPNGDILVLGNSKTAFNTKYHDGIKLLSKNGKLSKNKNLYQNVFTSSKSEKNTFRKGIVQPDGKVILYKIESTGLSVLVRYNDDFTIDTSFSAPLYIGRIYNLILLADGKILVTSDNQESLIRLNSDGSKDLTFASTKGFDNLCYTSAVQKDGKIIVAGNFTSFNEIKTNRIARFNSDGTFDNTFHPDENLTGFIYTTGLQSDGKIIIAGQLNFNAITEKACVLKRLNIDGSTDESFTQYNSTYVAHLVRGMEIQSNDQIILFTNRNSTTDYQINDFKRLEKNGEIDNTFDSGEGFDGNISAIKIQKDGKLLVTGSFVKYKSSWSNGTVRLLGTKSTLDTPDYFLNKGNSNFVLFPNPVKDVLNISSDENQSIKSIQIYNTLGQSVLDTKNIKTFSNINVSELNKGIYFVKINSDKGTVTNKFLKN
ncbi:T9SS C-terminal target domain-containing protein [Flavobacterium circumlabens]|uniref:Delta-60 repeat protein/predicted secreted protein (Por secretion system target) n=1 Tax=Flavobacterium circumlabens TaxID=2133765 RepID=A0A4Y7UBL3_9FLAO|nr:T9SS type A sorting domain-containing protein [Flavobacterium circumlabens]TCN57535.1 putative delta-60 repeat protein/predicted secreted protein (Por secretion system target) [Flavobacterium circumlabens]TEB43847.1 T9SS C-terminal target domain-containing protein [Flavobacterium circumlabens]